MKLERVKSTAVSHLGYDLRTRTVAVLFSNGGLYHYHDVPPSVYSEVRESGSIGRAVDRMLKRYPYSMMRESRV
jgi:hypothetical protein